MLLAQQGDRDALDAVLRDAQGPLYRYITRIVGDSETAKDVLQEVFVRIYRGLRWLREPALFGPWAFRIASREAFRAIGRRRRWQEAQAEEDEAAQVAAGDDPSAANPSREAIAEAVARLPPASRAVVVLHFLEEIPLAEVAAILAIPLGTAKSRLAYGLRCLRKGVERHD